MDVRGFVAVEHLLLKVCIEMEGVQRHLTKTGLERGQINGAVIGV